MIFYSKYYRFGYQIEHQARAMIAGAQATKPIEANDLKKTCQNMFGTKNITKIIKISRNTVSY